MTRVLVVDEHVSVPPRDGGSRSIFDLVRTLRELGCEVDAVTRADDLVRLVDDGSSWDTAFLSRPMTTLRWVDVVRSRTGGAVVYLGHDLHHRRMAQPHASITGEQGPTRAFAVMERQCWERCDLSLYPNHDEVDVAATVVGADRVAWFPYFRVDRTEPVRHHSVATSLVFLGGASHAPNVTGLRWFANEVAPFVEGPAPVVEVIGVWPDELCEELSSARVGFAGPLSDAELRLRLCASAAMVAPLIAGAGLKSKVVDALACATPLLTTTIGMQGIVADAPLCFVEDRATEWPSLIRMLRANGPEVRRRSEAGLEYVGRHHGSSAYTQAVRDVLGRCVGRRPGV